MANVLSSSRAPSCLNCLRQTFLDDALPAFHTPSRMQWRGKKKLPKATTIPIRLLKDTPKYGAKGSLIAVPPATMRNVFFPSRRADYLTFTERKSLATQVRERDYMFGVKLAPGPSSSSSSLDPSDPSSLPKRRSFALTPIRTLELLQKFVPQVLEYFRPVLQTPPLTPAGQADAEAVSGEIPTTVLANSVTSADIAHTIMSLLADGALAQGEKQAARVVIEPKDVEIQVGEEGTVVEGSEGPGAEGRQVVVDRVNSLGQWRIVVKVAGSDVVMRRKIRVNPEAASEVLMDSPAQAEITL